MSHFENRYFFVSGPVNQDDDSCVFLRLYLSFFFFFFRLFLLHLCRNDYEAANAVVDVIFIIIVRGGQRRGGGRLVKTAVLHIFFSFFAERRFLATRGGEREEVAGRGG